MYFVFLSINKYIFHLSIDHHLYTRIIQLIFTLRIKLTKRVDLLGAIFYGIES